MAFRTRSSLTHFIQSAVLLSTVSCRCCQSSDGPPEPPPQPDAPIASVEIVPAHVSVVQGTEFVMRARVKDQWGNVLPDSRASGVRWTTSGGLAVAAGPSASVVVTATPNGAQPLPADVFLIASMSGVDKSDSSSISITTVPESAEKDWIASEYAAKNRPTLALVTGTSSSGEEMTRTNSVVAFVREGKLDPLSCPTATPSCGALAVFSPGRAVTLATVKWSPSCDFASFATGATVPTGCGTVRPGAALPNPVSVSVVVWTLSNAPNIDNQVLADIAYAESVFDQPLTGLKLVFTTHQYAAGKHGSITHGVGCKTKEGTELAKELGFGIPLPEFQPKRITVAYVDAINPSTGNDIGFTCNYDDVTGAVIIVSADAINNSTLAHELGHALSQWHSSDRDHPDVPAPRLAGFEPSNLMWSSESDWGTSLRRTLTLGQLFQMSFADFSFVQRSRGAAATGLPCSSDAASNSPCPALAKDERQ
ncbi:MAG: hypothetical protein ACJ772_06910 [Gemmatimonadaceae bacterium]